MKQHTDQGQRLAPKTIGDIQDDTAFQIKKQSCQDKYQTDYPQFKSGKYLTRYRSPVKYRHTNPKQA